MIGIAIFLAGAAVAHGIARWLNLPSTPLLIAAGVVLGRLQLLPVELLQEVLVLGLTFLLFATGIELSPRRVGRQQRAALQVGVLQFGVLGVLGIGVALLLGMDTLTALYLGLALTASSTLVVVRLLQRRKQLFEPSGRLVVGVLLLQDLLVILLIPLLIRAPEGLDAVVRGVLGTLAMVALVWVVQRWITPRVVKLHAEEEVFLLLTLVVLFVFVGLADALTIPLAAGAFLAGVAVSRFPMSGLIRGQLSSFSDFFTAIFFLALGAILVPPSFAVLAHAVIFALLVMLVTPVLVAAVARRAGFALRPSIETGLLLSQTSELSLVVGLQGLVIGQITQDVFTTLALVTVTTMALTPAFAHPRVTRFLLRLYPSGRPAPEEPHEGHVLLLGCGAQGMPLLETLILMGEDVVVIDDDPEVVRQLRQGEVYTIRGDASDPEVLRKAAATRAKLVSSTIRRPHDNAYLLEAARGLPVLVRVFEDADAEWVRERGGIPILYSDAAAEEFVRWFRATHPPKGERDEVESGARSD
jgi:Kef-type K+ transport system membrane component KefB